ncbi:MAG: glutamate--cysteine ligase [Gammaproteobacteria bacterium]
MNDIYNQRVQALFANNETDLFSGARRGVEKENLRITPLGKLAQTPHPRALGAALTNKFITTDYSEALLEFVTPPVESIWGVTQYLCDIHQYVYSHLDNELLWPYSMPCSLASEADIPLALYGSSNVGQMKTIYRRGLGHRYGRYMQVISGMHFNYSLPPGFWNVYRDSEMTELDAVSFQSDSYLDMVRNVRRLDWMLLYLFGASPALCNSFLAGRNADLDALDEHTSYLPYATSLRMSDLGYQNSSQASLRVSANSLDDYISDLSRAITTPHADYQKIGIKNGDKYLQLNANFLQIENEYYSTIRPKRVARSGEHPSAALRRAGVEYVELRALDVSPFDPVGINQTEMHFLEIFLLYCLLEPSPAIESTEDESIKFNHGLVAKAGRKPGLELARRGKKIVLQQWLTELLDQMMPLAELLDRSGEGGYREALVVQQQKARDAALTPSALLLADLSDSGLPFAKYALQVAETYRDYFGSLATEHNSHFAQFSEEATESIERQRAIESADNISLEQYMKKYFS